MHVILLTGAALIGLPILLHLIMRQEPKKLPFPAFRFLKLRRRINQRKIRLRHLILLLLRMFLIALVAMALFQPRLLSSRFNIKGDSPIACAIVIDTSTSMGYNLVSDRKGLSEIRKRGLSLLDEAAEGPWTMLDEGRFRALEVIDELPPNSKVAVIDTADRNVYWSLTLDEARKKIRDIKKPRVNSRSVTQALEMTYDFFARDDQEAGQETMPRLLCIFSDRTVPSWEVSQLPNLTSLKERVPPPAIHTAYIDVGVEKPLNLAIANVEMKPQLVAANQPVEFTVTLEATGSIQENTIQVRFDDETDMQKQAVRVEPGSTREVPFKREGLKPGLHQVEITLATTDALPNDNIRYLTFRVREPRQVLIVADAPSGLGGLAGSLAQVARAQKSTYLWRKALDSTAAYACDITTTADFIASKKPLGEYEAIILSQIVEPSANLWDKLAAYVKQGGGKLVVVPGADELNSADHMKPPIGFDNELLPGPLKKWITIDPLKTDVTWTWDALKAHPLLDDFKKWLREPKIDFVAYPPRVWGYWEVEVKDKPSVIVSYNDDPNADKRHPALLEKQHGQRGRVLLFTTPMDGRYNEDLVKQGGPKSWNDYLETSFYLVLTDRVLRYLTGDTDDAIYNYTSGQSAMVKWPLDAASRSKTYYLSGPDVAGEEAALHRDLKESVLRLGPDKLKSAGNYVVVSDTSDQKLEVKPWRDGFSVNPSGDENNLERVPLDQIEPLLGPDSVTAADKERKLKDILSGKFSAPVELFPFLMILLLLFLAFENLLSNRFYKQAKPTTGA